MADDNSRRFSLTKIRNVISGSTAADSGTEDKESEELSDDAMVKSMDGSDSADVRKPFQFEQPDYDRTEAPKDEMRKYWRQFETTPIVRKPITSFASRVTEPGYFIEARGLSKDDVDKIGDWLDQCAIIEGQPGRDFRLLAKKAVIQREVRGTSLVEVAPDSENNDRIAGLKLINPETMEAVTRPNQAILMAPDDIDQYEDAPEAESGGAAAWLQDVLETDQTHFGTPIDHDDDGDYKIGFRRDEVIPLARDADVGEVFGTSRIEAVSDRIDGIKQKLADNDEAIASKAYPLWLFMFGSEEEPWDSKDINQFMQAHEMENFHPGMKQGVRGDVSVETISGEVADIAGYLDFDLRWIMSAMPMPMFVLGSFGSGGSTARVGQVSGVAQQQDINRQIKEARRELEVEFTPVIREVAKQQAIDEDKANDIMLKIGNPGDTDLKPERNEQVIRYISDAKGGTTRKAEPSNDQDQPSGNRQTERPDGIVEKGETPQSVDNPTPDQDLAGVDDDGNPQIDFQDGDPDIERNSENSVWETSRSSEALSSNDSNAKTQIAAMASDVFRKTRDRTLEKIEDRYAATPRYAVSEFANIANRELNQAIREANISRESKDVLSDKLDDAMQELGGSRNPFTDQQNTRFFANNVENAVRDAAEEMLRKARLQTRRAIVNNEPWSEARARVEQDFNDSYLEDRANLIAQMEVATAVESTKLSHFEQADNIAGFRVVNESPQTPLTEELNGVEVRFDQSDDIAEQIRSHASQTRKGFDPLPTTPPFHFGDTTKLEPIYRD